MSCLLLKGSSEHPAPPKEEVKGPEVGGCKRGHEREAEIIINTEAADIHRALRACTAWPPLGPRVSHKPPRLSSTLNSRGPLASEEQPATHRAGESSPVPRRASDMGWGWGASCHPQGDIRSLLTPGSPGLPAHTSEMRPASPPSVSVRRWVRAAPDPLCARGLPDPVAQVRAHRSPVGTAITASSGLLSPLARTLPQPPPASTRLHIYHLRPRRDHVNQQQRDAWIDGWAGG